MALIILTGRLGSGKDTVANIIERILFEYNIETNRISLADPLKDICCDILNLTRNDLEVYKRRNRAYLSSYITMRQFIINVARNVKKLTNDNIFITQALDKLIKQDNTVNIITDMRYTQEYEKLSELDFPNKVIIKITRKDVAKIEDESDIDTFRSNYTIENDNSIDDLEKVVKNTLMLVLDSFSKELNNLP